MKKIIIIVVVLVLVGLVFLYLAGQRTIPVINQQPTVNNQQPAINNQQLTINNQQLAVNNQLPRELTEEEKTALLKDELKIKARNFTERYGSFSTDVRLQNFKDLKGEMSNRFWRETEDYILTEEKKLISEFYGMTTRVLNVEEKSFSESRAEYLVSCQRQETKGTSQKVFYQNLELKMIQENGEWRVDDVRWK